MKRFSSGLFRFLVALLIVTGSMYIGYQSISLIKLGLDLNGGVSITYKSKKPNPTSQELSDAVYKMQLKALIQMKQKFIVKEMIE